MYRDISIQPRSCGSEAERKNRLFGLIITIEIIGLTHKYETKSSTPHVALDNITASINIGEVRGLLGPNGAGKTTLMKILSGLLIPTAGHVSVLGYDLVKDLKYIKQLTGIVFGGDRGLYSQLTSRETLEYWASLYNVPKAIRARRIDGLLERFGLSDKADVRIETFSRGMKQRLHLARGLISDAKILLFDEPTMGMDPIAARDFRNLIFELKNEGRVVLIATHDMAEAEAICDQVMLIDRGRILATETPSTLSRLVSDISYIEIREPADDLICDILKFENIISHSTSNGVTKLFVDSKYCYGNVMNALAGIGINDMETKRPTLEDVYIKVIGDRGFQI